jgi:alkaline phosphatase D
MKNSRRTFLAGAAAAGVAAPLPAWAEPNPEGSPRLMLGPMVGAVTQNSAPIWMQLSGGYFDAVVEYTTDPAAGPWRRTPAQRARKEDDYTLVIRMEGLQPDTTYHYRVLANGRQDKYLRDLPPFRVRTAPAKPSRFRVAFGSCARAQSDPEQPIWRAIAQYGPDLFLWLGENIHGDSTEPAMLAQEYQRQRFVPSFQPIGRNVPQLAIWGDHDFGLDNFDRTNPIKQQALQIFRQYWANPGAGLPDAPGVFFDYAYGGVDFFFLDDRYHRAPDADEDTPEKELLGKGQFRIGGVVLLSGDTHFPYVACAPWSEQGGYDFYELVSSALAQVLAEDGEGMQQRIASMLPDRMIRSPLLSINNAGIIDFDLSGKAPTLSFNVIDVRGRELYTPVTLRADELVNGRFVVEKQGRPVVSGPPLRPKRTAELAAQ